MECKYSTCEIIPVLLWFPLPVNNALPFLFAGRKQINLMILLVFVVVAVLG